MGCVVVVGDNGRQIVEAQDERKEIFWFLHTKRPSTIQFNSFLIGIEASFANRRRFNEFNFLNVTRVCVARVDERRMRAEENQNILNAYIESFRFITLDLWNHFWRRPKSRVDLHRARKRRWWTTNEATVLNTNTSNGFYRSTKMSSPQLIINWRLIQISQSIDGRGINSLHHIFKTPELNWIKAVGCDTWNRAWAKLVSLIRY